MRDKVFTEESKSLSKVTSLIKDAKVKLETAMESLGAFNLEKLKELRENPATNAADFLQFLDLLDSKNAAFNLPDKYKKLEELEFLSKEPYFSRIDLHDPKTKKTIQHYIGKFGFTEKKKPVVIDWRAKVASVYYRYRYPQKGVKYTTPKGVLTKDLVLKRTFEIDDGELIKYYNNDIKLDESEIIADKLGERTGGVLEDIIETIQKSQHEIIEADPRRVCIVQGTVGSGKSTVAIHKLSYIFFNYPEVVKPEKSILIAKSQILVGYLSTLFPKLGIFDINYGTIRDILYKILFTEGISSDFDLSTSTDISRFNFNEIQTLMQKIDEVHSFYDNALYELFNKDAYESFGGYVYDNTQPVRQNFTEAIQDLEEERRFQVDFIKEKPNHPRSRMFQENVKTMRKIIKHLSDLRSSIRTKALKDLAKEYKIKASGEFGYREALIYVVLHSELIGFTKFTPFEYCVVDEGQDFGILEYFVLDKLVRNGRFCILGDLNQSYEKEGIAAWEDIFEVVEGAKDAQAFTLDTNYRSTKPIVNYANEILKPYTDQYLPIPIDRKGAKPNIKQCATNNDVIAGVTSELETDIKKLDKSIGIICLNEKYLKQINKILLASSLPKEKIVRLEEKERIRYLPRAVYLTHFDNCKGLEFGKVYVVGLNPTKINTFVDAKKAFVAVTRAMNDLSIYYEKD